MSQAIEAMKTAFSKLSAGAANVPIRTNLLVNEQTQSLTMPVSIEGFTTFGLKAVSITADNCERGLPMIHGLVLLFDSTTGEPKCLMDGEFLTALRTGAASGLATDLLAKPNSKNLVVFGTGRQAFFQVLAVLEVRPIDLVTVVSRNPDLATKFCQTITELGNFDLKCVSDTSVVRQADIICTATPSITPLFSSNDLPKESHINAVGSYRSDMCEIDLQLLDSMTIVVDQYEASLKEAGEIVQAVKEGIIHESAITEIGEFLLASNRRDIRKRTLFKSVGNAAQDLVVADFVLNQANQRALGQLIEL